MRKTIKKDWEVKGLFPHLTDKWGRRYYIIETSKGAFYCFKKEMKEESWRRLTELEWAYCEKIQIEYEEIEKNGKHYKKVISWDIVGCRLEDQYFKEKLTS